MLTSTFTGLQLTLSLTIRVYLYSFSSCCLPNLRNPAKFSENSNLQQFKVIQGHQSLRQSKAHMQLPISQITLGVSSYGFRDIKAFLLENSLFSPSYLCLTPPIGGKPCDNNVICTSLESKFNGLQFCRCQYRSIFIHLAVVVFVGFQIYEISRNSKRI